MLMRIVLGKKKHTPCNTFYRCSELSKSAQVAHDAIGIPHVVVLNKAHEVQERKLRRVCSTVSWCGMPNA